MRILILILVFSLFGCNEKKEAKEAVGNYDCIVVYNKFRNSSAHHNPTSYYDDLKLMGYLRYMLNSSCDLKTSSFAGNTLFFSILIKNKTSHHVDFELSHLSSSEIQEAIKCLKTSSNGGYIESTYLLGVLYLNGKYIEKDSVKGLELLKKSKPNLKEIKYALKMSNLNTNNLKTMYYIPKDYYLTE